MWQSCLLYTSIGKGRNDFAVFLDLAGMGIDVDDIAHVHFRHVAIGDRQRACVFLSVEEDRRDLAAQAVAAKALVRDCLLYTSRCV